MHSIDTLAFKIWKQLYENMVSGSRSSNSGAFEILMGYKNTQDVWQKNISAVFLGLFANKNQTQLFSSVFSIQVLRYPQQRYPISNHMACILVGLLMLFGVFLDVTTRRRR